MIVIRILVATTIAIVFFVPLIHPAQLDPEQGLDEARALYLQGRFDETITKLGEVIDALELLRELEEKKLELADAHFLLGLSYIAVRDEVSAKDNFARTAFFDPERVLDPDVHAPKVVSLYEEAQIGQRLPPEMRGLEQIPIPEPQPTPEPEYPPAFAPGTRARASLVGENGTVVGTVVSVDADFLTLVTENQRSVSLPRDDVAKLEISTGRKGHALWGALIGAGAGALIGLAEGADDCVGDECYTRGENVAYGALGAGMIGALVGALYRTDRWVTVPSTGIRVGVDVTPRGAGVSMTWSF